MGTELATLALGLTWSDDQAREIGGNPQEAIDALRAREVALKQAEPQGGKNTDALKKALGMLGAKISPTMSPEQSNAWASTMVIALSDLPAAFSRRGAADAIHVPMKFLNEVEAVVRDKAAAARERHHHAIWRLRRFEAELRGSDQPALPAPPRDEDREMTQDDINAMPRPLLNVGLARGWITQEQFDIATQPKDETNDRDQ